MKSGLLFLVVTLLLLCVTVNAVTTYNCLDASTLNKTVMISINGSSNVFEEVTNCTYGCVNGMCAGQTSDIDMMSVWLVYAIGVVLLVLGTVMGMPMGEVGEVKKRFDTTMVVKYLFFFVGLFFVYLSLGMLRRVGTVYGTESNLIGAMDTSTMVIMITIVLFLFIFIIEFIFGFLRTMMATRYEKEWGEREEGKDE